MYKQSIESIFSFVPQLLERRLRKLKLMVLAVFSGLLLTCGSALAFGSPVEPGRGSAGVTGQRSASSQLLAAAKKSKAKNAHKDKSDETTKSEKSDEAGGDEAKPKKHRSQENRVGKSYVVLGEIGLVNFLHAGYGVSGGYFLSPNEVIEGDFFTSSFSFLGYKSDINLVTAHMKWFMGNSFYINGGGGLRMLSVSDGLVTSSGQDFVGEFSIGNRWHFSAFTIGCDWVGYALPIFALSSSESASDGATDSDIDSGRSNFQSQKKGGSLSLVRFQLGWSF